MVAAEGHGAAPIAGCATLQLSGGVISSLASRIRSSGAHSLLWLRPEAAL
jgi:hypothetical protein